MKKFFLLFALILGCAMPLQAAQHDLDITTQDANTGVTFRAQVNSALQALATHNSGTGDPAITYPYEFKIDESVTPHLMYIRKGDNSAWVRWGSLDGTTGQLIPDTAAIANALTPGAAITSPTTTGTDPGAETLQNKTMDSTCSAGAAVFKTQNIVTGSRTFGTIYQNTTGKTMMITVATTLGSGEGLYGESGAVSPPTSAVAEIYNNGLPQIYSSMSFMVIPGNYYRVQITNGAPSLICWTEWY